MNLDQRREEEGGEGRRGRTIFQTTNEAIVDASDYGKKFVGVAHTYVKHLITMQSLRDRASFSLVSKLRFTVSLNNFDLSASRFFVEQRIPPPCISVTSIETLLPELFNCPTYTRHVKTPIARFGQKRKKPPPPLTRGTTDVSTRYPKLAKLSITSGLFYGMRTSLRESREHAFNHPHSISLNPKNPKIHQNRLNYIFEDSFNFEFSKTDLTRAK